MHSAKDDPSQQSATQNGPAKAGPDKDLANALRRAYEETLNESVPDDLLDLLKKLD